MFSFIKSYQRMDPAARNPFEVFFLYPGPKAVLFHRLAHQLYNWGIPFLPRLMSELSRWITGIEIHPGAQIGHDCVFDHGMGIVIGETAIVGDRVLIYHGVTLGSVKHTLDKRHPTIEDDVILGAGCKILGNITVGHDSRVAANAVLLKDIPPGSTASGIPAKIIEKGSTEYDQWNLDYYI